MIISVEKTAIYNGVAKSVTDYHHLFNQGERILDYGAGRLRNAKYLKEKGLNVSILDTPIQIERIEQTEHWEYIYNTREVIHEKFEGIFCTFVLNVVPCIEIRRKIIKQIHNLLTPTGLAIIEVRSHKGILLNKYKEPFEDGYIVGNKKIKTFQKGYTLPELVSFMNEESFEIIREIKYADSVSVVVRRKEK